jgi:hypothetical protein
MMRIIPYSIVLSLPLLAFLAWSLCAPDPGDEVPSSTKKMDSELAQEGLGPQGSPISVVPISFGEPGTSVQKRDQGNTTMIPGVLVA